MNPSPNLIESKEEIIKDDTVIIHVNKPKPLISNVDVARSQQVLRNQFKSMAASGTLIEEVINEQ